MGVDKSYKNFFDNGITTYHADGSKSVTYKNLLDNGTTTYHSDGSKSETYKNVLDSGYTTYHEDGSRSKTYRNFFDSGVTTYHEDGSKSRTYKNILDSGYTTYHDGIPPGTANYGYYSPSDTGKTKLCNARYTYVPGGLTAKEKVLEKKHDRLFSAAVITYLLPTAYVAVTLFVKSLPTSYILMLVLLLGAIFLDSFFTRAADVHATVTEQLFLLIIQSLIYFFQVVCRLNRSMIPFSGKGDLFVMMFGPILFLVAIIIGRLVGRMYGKTIADKTLHPQHKQPVRSVKRNFTSLFSLSNGKKSKNYYSSVGTVTEKKQQSSPSEKRVAGQTRKQLLRIINSYSDAEIEKALDYLRICNKVSDIRDGIADIQTLKALSDVLVRYADKAPKSVPKRKTLEEMLEENKRISAQISASSKTAKKK